MAEAGKSALGGIASAISVQQQGQGADMPDTYDADLALRNASMVAGTPRLTGPMIRQHEGVEVKRIR